MTTSTLPLNNNHNFSTFLFYTAPALFGVLVAVFYGVHDYWLDDFEFSRFLSIGSDGSWSLPDVATLRSLVAERWRFDSFRLCNFAVPPLLLLPRWFTAAVMGVCWTAAAIVLMRLAQLRSPRAAWVVVGLMAVMPPWWAYLPTLSSNLNYVASLLVGAVFLDIFLRQRQIGWLPALISGIVTGWWHEGLSAPLIAAVVAVMMLFSDYRCRKNYMLLAGLVIGFIILNVNPGFLYRLRLAHGADTMYGSGVVTIINLAINCLLPATFLCISVFSARRLIRTPLWVTFFVIMAVSLLLEAASGIVRSSFMSQYISCVAVVWVASEAWWERFRRAKDVLAFMGGVVCTVTFIAAICDGIKVNAFNRRFIEANLNQAGQVVFADAIMPGEGSLLALGKSPAMMYQLPAFYYVYPSTYEDMIATKVIPAEFSDFIPGANGWQPTPAGNWHRGYAMVMPYDGEETDRWRRVEAEAQIPGLGPVRMVVNVLPFRATDGNVYQAVVLNEQPPYQPAPTDIRITRPHGIFSFW